MNYYRAEFYDSGDQKACIEKKESSYKPRNQFKRVHGMKALVLWFSSESIANRLVTQIRNNTVGFDYAFGFYMPRSA